MRVVIFAVVILLHACQPFGTLNALAPSAGITFTRDVPYASGERHTLDVYSPTRTAEPAPVIVFFYGGGWETGNKAMYRFVGAALAARGIVVVIPDYRLYPAVQFPAFVQDAAAAVAWVHVNAKHFGGDRRRLFLMGHSAGAQIATLLALNPEYLRAAGLPRQGDVCGVIGLAGPYDFLPFDAALQAVFGPADNWPRSQPINYVTAEAPPMLLLVGGSDGTVNPGNTLRLAARLHAAGAQVESDVYRGVTHMAIIASIADSLTFLAPTREATLNFVNARGACD